MSSVAASNHRTDEIKLREPRTYKVQYSLSQYTFPAEPSIEAVWIDDRYLHVELVDERIISIPLWWIPTLSHATPSARQKVIISEDRSALIWDPAESGINETLLIDDYVHGLERRRL